MLVEEEKPRRKRRRRRRSPGEARKVWTGAVVRASACRQAQGGQALLDGRWKVRRGMEGLEAGETSREVEQVRQSGAAKIGLVPAMLLHPGHDHMIAKHRTAK